MDTRSIQLPLYALPASRSISVPSVLLNPSQSRLLKKKIVYGYEHKGGLVRNEREIYELVKKVLIDCGWQRVEFHGDCIMLFAIVHLKVHERHIDGYIDWAKSTGIWSIMDYIRWGRVDLKVVTSEGGQRQPIKHKTFPGDEDE